METITKIMKMRYLRRFIIYFLTCNLVLNTWLPAVLATPTPIDGGFTEGTGTITQAGTATNVVVNQAQSVIEWSSLDTIGGAPGIRESLNFSQAGPTNSAVLNRVMSGYGTQFYGDLNAEGMRIFIVNPAGVVFGEGSTVNVTQLIASSLDISNDKFLSGDYDFAGDIEGVDVYERLGVINNSKDMYASESVALIGRKIFNAGTISTGEGGFVVMAAGDRVLLGQPGSNVVIKMDSVTMPGEGDGDVINDGLIESKSGTIVLAAGDMFASALELERVSGGIGRVEQNGTINADGLSGDGGNVILTAGDEVILSADSMTKANAGTTGDGGLVVVHSKGQTTVQADAQIEAMGGHEPYDIIDDFDDVVNTSVEISGDYVSFAGDVDASASYGKRGKVIIDALYMTIEDGYMPDAPPDNTVYEKWIESQSYASTDVELVAHAKTGGNIITESMSDGVIEGGSGDIVLRTKYDTGGITFMPGTNGDRTAIHTTQGGNVYMLAGGDDPDTTDVIEGGIAVGDIISFVPQHAPEEWIVEPGKIRLLTTNYGNITTGQLSVDGGSYDEISVIASGDLLVNGDVTTYAHQVDEGLEVSQARTCLVSEHGDVEINGIVTVEAHAKYESTADIHIDAGRDVRIDLGGGQIRATALTSAEGSANASVLIHAGKDTEPSEKGNISITNPKSAGKAIYLRAQTQGSKSEIYSDGKAPKKVEITDGGSHAKLELDEKHTGDCPECPTPPGLVPPLDPWAFVTHMGYPTSGNVFEDENKIGILEVKPDDSWEEVTLESWEVQTPHGTLIIAKNGDYEYKPNDGYVGDDSFAYQAKVKDSGLETDWVMVTITMINELPVANPGSASKHMGVNIENESLNYSDVPDELGITDKNLTVEIVTKPLYGDVELQWDETSGTWTYTYVPKDDGNGYFAGTDSFEYTVTDPQGVVGQFGTAQVTITMTNELPVANPSSASGHMGTDIENKSLDYSDVPDQLGFVDEDLTVDIVTKPLYGDVELQWDETSGTWTYTYVPDKDGAGYFAGTDSFEYTVTDPQGNVGPSGTAQVTINMTNDLPVAADDQVTTNIGVPVGGNVLVNDFDQNKDPLSVVLDGALPQHGQLVLNKDGTFTYVPDDGFSGQDSFTYLVTDNQFGGEPAGAKVTVTVNPGEEPPLPPPPAPTPAIASALQYIPPAPGLERVDFEISGCPALVKWAAAEFGIDERMMQIWAVNTLASSQDIQPCDACARLKGVAAILQDVEGTRIAALSQVINEFASSTAPPTPEQMASVADAIQRNSQAYNHYAAAGEYLDALVAYVGILSNDMKFSPEEAVMFAVDNYVAPLADENQNAGLAVFIAARLASLGGS
jgi:filamentous hemagglutinin family protein